jgi:fido (protein-threonine AMPylation protein)
VATPKNIAESLGRVLEAAKKNGGNIVLSADIERADRELLVRTKWLQEIIKGWYMLVRPDVNSGDSTVWYANFWDFVRIYLAHHYGEEYCLSAVNSLELHIGSSAIPKQVLVLTARGGGKSQSLLFDTSVFAYTSSDNLPEDRTKIKGLHVMNLPFALCKVTPSFFRNNPIEAKIALKAVRSHFDFVQVILKHKFKRAAARIIGAYYFLGDEKMAKAIETQLSESGMRVTPENPFDEESSASTAFRERSPYMLRIFTMWESFRQDVIDHFPATKPHPKNVETYLKQMEKVYAQDAYNSLSIEGYVVDQDLIERVKKQDWNPDTNDNDRNERDAMAARGYYEAHQEVKKSVTDILNGRDPGEIVEQDLSKWYRALFNPSARAGIIPEEMLYGYRKGQVYIRNSRHVPLPKDALLDAMDAFFTCVKNESHAAVRAVLGHFFFVFIHPYMDGNGRIGRFLMNALACDGGYPWTIIRVKHREKYFKSLEAASVDKQIIPFTKFIASEMAQG